MPIRLNLAIKVGRARFPEPSRPPKVGWRPWRGSGKPISAQSLRHGTNALNAQEVAFLDHAPGGFGAMIRNLARYDIGAARAFVDVGAPVIAIELVNTVLQDLLRAAQVALASTNHAYTGQLIDQIEGVQRELWQQYQSAANRHGNPQTLATFYNTLIAAAKADAAMTGDHQR